MSFCSVDCLFTLCPLKHKVFNFDDVQFIFFFFILLLVVLVSYLIQGHKDILLFSSMSFAGLALTLGL